jgi:hypothetical protein
MKGTDGKPVVKYMRVLFDTYTPAVEGQMLRDCLVMMEVARHRYNEVVIVCEDERPDRMLNGLGLTRLPEHPEAKDCIMYRTSEQWPDEPEGIRTLIQRDLWVPVKDQNMTVLDEQHTNGYYLPPQGRLSPDTLSLLRPAPNGYIPTDPALLMLWT